MPPPRRPHPRSLDALFPKPKPPPVKRCAGGHRQSTRWKSGDRCSACDMLRDASLPPDEERRAAARREREAWSAANPVGPVLTMRVVSTGRLIVHAIPKHLQKRKARGPGRRRRV